MTTRDARPSPRALPAGVAPRARRALAALAITGGALAALDLHPGANAKLAAGTFTWDCYLPKQYAEKPEARFPVMYLQAPWPNTGTWGLEGWAEKRGVILISINESCNDASDTTVRAAQAAVMAAADAHVRLHPALRYTFGTSGGGKRSIMLINSAPERFAGSFINVHSAGPPPKHMACVYVGGEADTTHPIAALRGTVASARSQGNQVTFIADPGDHDTACHNGDRAAPYLDWLLFATCMQHPKLTPADLAEGGARIDAEIAEIAALAAVTDRVRRCETLLAIAPIAGNKRLGGVLRTTWIDAAMSTVGGEPIEVHKTLTAVAENPLFASVDAKAGKALVIELKALRKDEPVKSEWAALQGLRGVVQAEKKAGNTKGALKEVAKSYVALAKTFPEAAARRVSAKLGQ